MAVPGVRWEGCEASARVAAVRKTWRLDAQPAEPQKRPQVLGRRACLSNKPCPCRDGFSFNFPVAPFCHFATEAATPLQLLEATNASHHEMQRAPWT